MGEARRSGPRSACRAASRGVSPASLGLVGDLLQEAEVLAGDVDDLGAAHLAVPGDDHGGLELHEAVERHEGPGHRSHERRRACPR